MLAKIAMIAMTTSSSMSVKPMAVARRPNSVGAVFDWPLGRFDRERCRIRFIIFLPFFSAT
jgi:membrane protein YqaA with SNARE-associated domain